MRLKSDMILLFVAALWGTGFLAQRLATTQLNAFYFNGGRFLIAALVILLATKFQKEPGRMADPRILRHPILWMSLAGALLFSAAGLQQVGLATTSIGNASFITGLYVVLVPVILFVFLRQQISWLSWFAVAVAGVGVALLGLQGHLRLAPGDILELIGALLWALHVITVGWLARKGVNVLWFSIIQFATCAALNLVLAVALDPGGAQGFITAWPVVLYSALFPISLGYTLQIVGQKYAPALDAAILLSMEDVFATVLAFIFFNEQLGPRQVMGCALILAATILAQLRVETPQVETVS
ncbi:MAG TPA: DMT family transporter [Anaerolineaceae bacterium]